MTHYYLIYCSEPRKQLTGEEVEGLLAVSRKQNAIHDVTGMLLCLPDSYIQLIEGPEDKIRQLYRNLIKDTRHHKVSILKEGLIHKRFFPAWSMGYDQRNVSVKNPDESFDLTDDRVFALFDILNE